ncbi:MAG: terminase large subunit [Amphiplicatus sp.]
MDAAARQAIGRYGRAARAYAEAIADAPSLACRWARLAARRHLDDLAAAERGEGPWTFDDLRAFRACAFLEALPHVKGTWAARREKLTLAPWQVFVTASIFGWVSRETGRRRFRRALIVVPRKNGKSAWAAGVGLYMLAADGEHGAEVYSGATSEKQAMEVFRPARQMAAQTPRLLDRFGLEVCAKSIVSVATGGRFEPVIGKPGDGASPSCAIIDEYHEHETDELVETMRTGMGARAEPLLLMITTAGDNLAGPCYAAVQEAQTMLEGAADDPSLFAVMHGVDKEDDWTTDAALKKANPNYGVSVSAEFLRAERDDALRNARRQGVFRTKHLNEWIGARSAYFNVENFRRCADPALTLGAFDGAPCWIGLDLASTTDIAAAALLFRRGDGWAVFTRNYLPAAALKGRNREIYAELVRRGRLTVAGDGMTDQARIEADLRSDLARFDVRALAFDPWNAGALIARLQAAGAPVVEFRKSVRNVSMPMKALAGLIDEGRLAHDGDPALAWMLANVVAREDANENVFPAKPRPDAKIDAADALIAALALALADEAAGAGERAPLVFVA